MKYPIGIQTFSKIRENDYLYIDKTAVIYDLISHGEVYFFSRPRRFGKSLLISTLESLFNGEKHLFDGLAIANTDYDFTRYAVLRFDFSEDYFDSVAKFEEYISNTLDDYAQQYDIELTRHSANQKFKQLVVRLYEQTGLRTVVLIDEYDKPILSHLNGESVDVLLAMKAASGAFYGVIKALDKYLKFVFITGVSKFSKVSVFSGMNSLRDISMDENYTSLCGVSQQELEHNFTDEIAALSAREELSLSQMLAKIKYWYNGYRFHHLADSVYNPLSLVMLFSSKDFNNYWFATATPTFLIELIKVNQFDLSTINHFEVDNLFFTAIEPERMQPEPVLLQAGYLTIVGYHDGLYRLDFPNYEVKQAFNQVIVQEFGGVAANDMRYVRNLCQCLRAGEVDEFIATLQTFFANIPYGITLKDEKYYQSLFYAVFTLIGFDVQAEVQTNRGRIDCVIETEDKIYVIEFKLQGTKEQALEQIIDRQYAQKYQDSGKTLVLLGVEFNQTTRNIGGFVRG